MGIHMSPDVILTLAIPTFNRAEYLSELLNQINSDLNFNSVGRLEVLVVNNDSTDCTEEIVLEKNMPALRYIKNPFNIGGDSNFINCVRHASGEYVWLFGDDEIYIPGALNRVLAAIECKPALLIVESEFYERIEADSYGSLLKKALPLDPIFQVHHTLITKNVFPKSAFDLDFAKSKIDTNFSHIYGLLSHLSKPGKVVVFSKKEAAFEIRKVRAAFAVPPINLEKKLVQLSLDFSSVLEDSQLYRGTWMYYKARPLYNLVFSKSIKRIKNRFIG